MWWRRLRRRIRRWLDLAMDVLAMLIEQGRIHQRWRAAQTDEDRDFCFRLAEALRVNIMCRCRRVTGPTDRMLQRGGLRRELHDPRQLRFSM